MTKLEAQTEQNTKDLKSIKDTVEKLPTLDKIENVYLKLMNDHVEKKHKSIDLKTIFTFLMFAGTVAGAIIIALSKG